MVATGVALHLPMFWMARKSGFRLAGMPMDPGMLVGMALIVVGVIAAAYGLLPRSRSITPPEYTPLTKAHWLQIALLALALLIDVSKASTLGFVIPGMRAEYGLGSAAIAVLNYADQAPRLVSGAHRRHRHHWRLFCHQRAIGASATTLWMEGMWLIGFPTGLILIALSPMLPESARFLLEMGRFEDAHAVLARYRAVLTTDVNLLELPDPAANKRSRDKNQTGVGPLGSKPRKTVTPASLLGLSLALTLAALAWGFVNFGVLLWLPARLIAEGHSVGLASALIARSALMAVPTVALATFLYSVWSTRRVLILAIGVTFFGLLATLLRANARLPFLADPLVSVSVLIVGASGVISILLPYAAGSFPVRQRGRATGWVAGCSTVGGARSKRRQTRLLAASRREPHKPRLKLDRLWIADDPAGRRFGRVLVRS
jgi:MFS transporter, putative metabolite:H+ symporter